MMYTVGSDYNSGPYLVTIPAGENDVTFTITITDDDIREMSETFSLIIDPSSLPNGVTSSSNVTVTILDHDGEGRKIMYIIISFVYIIAVNVRFGMATYSVNERSNSKQRNAVVDLILNNPSSQAITLNVQSIDVTATGMKTATCVM